MKYFSSVILMLALSSVWINAQATLVAHTNLLLPTAPGQPVTLSANLFAGVNPLLGWVTTAQNFDSISYSFSSGDGQTASGTYDGLSGLGPYFSAPFTYSQAGTYDPTFTADASVTTKYSLFENVSTPHVILVPKQPLTECTPVPYYPFTICYTAPSNGFDVYTYYTTERRLVTTTSITTLESITATFPALGFSVDSASGLTKLTQVGSFAPSEGARYNQFGGCNQGDTIAPDGLCISPIVVGPGTTTDSVSIPEPGTLTLLAIGFLLILVFNSRHARVQKTGDLASNVSTSRVFSVICYPTIFAHRFAACRR